MKKNHNVKFRFQTALLMAFALAFTLCVHAVSPTTRDSNPHVPNRDTPSFRMVAFAPEGENVESKLENLLEWDSLTFDYPDGNIDSSSPDSPEFVSIGEFCLTAYCGCAECCGAYAENRPVDEYGNEIVIGAAGVPLIQGVSIAADPEILPMGSVVYIDGTPYTVSDTGGSINGNRIDVYFFNHNDAIAFEVQYAEVFVEN